MTIKELRLKMMKAKKGNPEYAKAYSTILSTALSIAKNDGNRDVTDEDIISSAKKEVKMTIQSRDAGAPYNEIILVVADEFLPKMMSEDETRMAVENAVRALPEKSMKMMGKVMGQLSKEYDNIDKGLASTMVKLSLIEKENK